MVKKKRLKKTNKKVKYFLSATGNFLQKIEMAIFFESASQKMNLNEPTPQICDIFAVTQFFGAPCIEFF